MLVSLGSSSGRRVDRRRLRFESLMRRELLAVGDVCVPLTPEEVAASYSEATGSQVTESDAAGELIPTISIADAERVEGHAGATTMQLTVSLSAEATVPVTVDVATSNGSATGLKIDRIASGLDSPIYVTSPPGDLDRLFVVEKTGQIQILDLPSGQKKPNAFLEIAGLTTGGERGLLSLAFHPEYASNGRFYVYTSVPGGPQHHISEVREYTVSSNPDIADPASLRKVLSFDQPFGNHNGGWMAFGPDGYLYIASGDGGSGNDPGNRAQDITDNLLGKMLRIDVDGDDFPADSNRNYVIPTSNPFVGITGDDEIWAFGLRNPWRNSFDRVTGDLYIGDVGQNQREEINVQPGDSTGGENYGWRLREGTIQTPSVGGPKPPGAIDPIYDYGHGLGPLQGNSVTGGYVYRGPIEELQGTYFFGDFQNRRVWSLRFNGDAPSQHDGTNYDDFVDWTPLLMPDAGAIGNVSSFGEDAAGNLYVVDFGGEVFRFTEGADYLPISTTLTFDVGVTSQTFEVPVLGDRLFEGDETFNVTLSNPSQATLGDSVAVATIRDDEPVPPAVESVIVNDGSEGRSQITSLTVTFDTEVSLTGSAFVLTNLDTQQPVGTVQVATSLDSGRTVAVLTFADGPSVVTRMGSGPLGNSLVDAEYRLDIIASEVTRVSNSAQMVNDFAFGDQPADDFFRRYADTDGNRVVNLLDFADFRQTFGLSTGDSQFDSGLDSEGNGTIDLSDFAQFRSSFG